MDEGYGERKGLSRVDSELVKMKVEGITNEDLVTYLITRKDYTKEEAHLKVKELKKKLRSRFANILGCEVQEQGSNTRYKSL